MAIHKKVPCLEEIRIKLRSVEVYKLSSEVSRQEDKLVVIRFYIKKNKIKANIYLNCQASNVCASEDIIKEGWIKVVDK